MALSKRRFTILFAFLLIAPFGESQVIDLSSPSAYRIVFVETDDFDSTYLSILENGYREVLPDTLKLAIGNDLAYYWHTKNLDKALLLANQVYSLALITKNKIWQGRLQTTLGAILLRQDKLDTAFLVLQSAKEKLPKKDWPHLFTQMGYVMERKGMLSKAADYALAALHVGDSLNDLKARAMAYSDLSNLFWKQSKFGKGIEYGLESETLFKQRDIDDLDFSFTLYVIGNNYLSIKEYTKALEYFERGLVISDRYQFYNNLADIYISLANLYTATRDYTKAEAAVKNAIRYSALLKNNFMSMRSWLEMGKLQNLTNHSDKAIISLKTCLLVASKKFRDNYYLHIAYQELAKSYSKTGDYKNANAAFLKYDQLKDSVFTAEADQRVAQLQTEYEVAQKEITIKTQGQFISQQKKMQLLTLGGLALLVLLIMMLYRNYRGKQKINSQLTSLNEDLAQKNTLLDKRNADNELLLKEIHHRVKNNLEIVSGLLALQGAQIDHPSAQAVMQSSQNRVISMGIIHQKLYQKGNLAAIEMKDYFQNLGESILDTFDESKRIQIVCDMKPLELDVDTAVPLGLIANELLTNSLKYAFVGRQGGEIKISLSPSGNETELLFCVADNGVGKTENMKSKGTGFGTELIKLLVQQLNGSLSVTSTTGTSIHIHFKYTKQH